MVYFIVAAVAIISIIFYYYYKPEQKVTKNVFNAEYYRGLNYLLNNKEDRAFKIFTALMDVDSSTIETHLALGGLYRKRGEFDKAILIHQNLLSRPTLEKELKNQALYELAKDFHSAGLYDRSEKIFRNLCESNTYALSCYEELLKLYEVTKDWDKAINIINKSNSIEINNHSKDLLMSHYLCEISTSHHENAEIERAVVVSKKSLKISPTCLRPYLQLGAYYSETDPKRSLQYYSQAIQIDGDFSKYIVKKIINLTKSGAHNELIMDAIMAISNDKKLSFIPELYIYLLYKGNEDLASSYVKRYHAVNDYDDFIINSTLAISENDDIAKTPPVDNMISSYRKVFDKGFIFLCSNCGYKSNVLNWLCPSCNSWSSSKPITTFDLIDGGYKNARQ